MENKAYTLPSEAQFAVEDVARLNSIHKATAAAFVKDQFTKNLVTKSGKRETGKKGKPATLYSRVTVNAAVAEVVTQTPSPTVESAGTPIADVVNGTAPTVAVDASITAEPVTA